METEALARSKDPASAPRALKKQLSCSEARLKFNFSRSFPDIDNHGLCRCESQTYLDLRRRPWYVFSFTKVLSAQRIDNLILTASLLLARRLLRAKIPFQIFERDASLSFRGQGYRLRLSNEGLEAIEDVLAEDFPTFWEKCGKTGGAGFAALDAVTGEQIPDDPQEEKPQASEKNSESGNEVKAFHPNKESLTSRGGKTVGISRGDMRAVFMSKVSPHSKGLFLSFTILTSE